jgi:hypothetical protein
MADFAAVLRKTIDGLGENTPEMREKVYDKARATIEKKLASITPKPSKAVVTRQMNALEAAIEEVESDFAVAEAPLEDLDRILDEAETEASASDAPDLAAQAPVSKSLPDGSGEEIDEPGQAEAIEESEREFSESEAPAADTTGPERELPDSDPGGPDAIFAALHQRDEQPEKRTRRWIVPVIIILLLIVAAAAAWLRPDLVGKYTGIDIVDMIGGGPGGSAAKPEPAAETKASAETKAPAETKPASGTKEPSDNNAGNEAANSKPAESTPPEKFTQRLNSDGTEIDSGPAEGEPGVGEGSSVAAASAQAPDAGQPQASGQSQPSQAVSVGQKAYLYEEGTSSDQATAEAGNVVWSVVQEKPGGDAPPEPAIHGVLEIPAKNVLLKITIRRNADQTLPASHIIEVIFELPDGFGGGGISEMSRVAMKESEQSTGSPLLGVPAKISDGFFLVALTDAKAAIDTNTALLQRGEWIDIPVVYASGRRALFTMEKGIPGNRVFDEVMKSWQEPAAN